MDSNSAFEMKSIGPWSYFHVPSLERAGIVHGFMTRSSDSILSGGEEEKEFARALGAAAVVSLRQEHGDVVHVIGNGERPHAGDGFIVEAAEDAAGDGLGVGGENIHRRGAEHAES